MAALIENIAFWGSIVSAFAVFDAVVSENTRQKISWYMFGFAVSLSAREFSLEIIRSLVGIFVRNNKLSLWRVCLYSIAFGHIFSLISFVYFGWPMFETGRYDSIRTIPEILAAGLKGYIYFLNVTPVWGFTGLPVIVGFAVLFVPLDYWNLYVSKRIFDRNIASSKNLNFLVILDVCVSILPVIPFVVLVGYYNFNFTNMFFLSGTFLGSFLAVNLVGVLSVLFLFFIQVTMILSGFSLRLFALNANWVSSSHTQVHRFPFTAVGVLWATIVTLGHFFI